MGKERRKRQEKKGVMKGRSEKEGLRKKWRIWKTRVNDLMKDGEVKGGGRRRSEERGKQGKKGGRLVGGEKGKREGGRKKIVIK